jgi:hypothetical protein
MVGSFEFTRQAPFMNGRTLEADNWLWSSAGDYAVMKGLLDIKLMM